MFVKDIPEYKATVNNPLHISCGGVLYRVGMKNRLEVLLLHRLKKKNWDYDSWHLPKGTMRVGEDEKDCAEREIMEEAGYQVSLGKRIGVWESDAENSKENLKFTKLTFYYIVDIFRKVGVVGLEHDEAKWVPIEEAKTLLAKFPLWEKEEEVLEEFEKMYNK